MHTGRRNPSPIQQPDLVRHAHRTQTLGDHNGGAACHQPFQRQLDQPFSLGVDAGGGVVQDEDARVGEQGAGDRNTLFLTTGERDSTFTDPGSVAIRHLHNKVVGLGRTRGLDHILVACIRAAKGNVLFDGRCKERCVLEDHADLAA